MGARASIHAICIVVLVSLALTARPVLASTYQVTFNLHAAEMSLWTETLTIETPDTTVTLAVPHGLHNLIVGWYGTGTFITPFTLQIPLDNVTLQATSEPTGLTIVFVRMDLGDINGDKVVDIIDMVRVATVYGEYNMFADVNFDLRIDIYDLVTIAINFGNEY